MKSSNLLYLILISILISSCGEQKKKEINEESINYDENFQSIYVAKAIKDFNLNMSNEQIEYFGKNLNIIDSIGTKIEIYENLPNDILDDNLKSNDLFKDDITDAVAFFAENECWNERPKTIRDLTDGVLIDAYSFEKGDEKKLGILGFFNIKLTDKQKVIVVEYSQEGTQICNDSDKKYGVGARLMMQVIKSKRNAKLNTPQQITASVIFGRAEVTYSLRTFGITGPGIVKLNKTGALSEDTYQTFLQEISNLIAEMYKKESSFIVVPQPLPLKNIND